MSCIIFVLFINAILIYLIDLGLKLVAYVDGISLVIPKGNEQRVFSPVQNEAAHYNMQLNVLKNEILGLGSYTPPNVSLPNFVVPPDPFTDEVQASQPNWLAEPPVPYTMTRDIVNGLVPKDGTWYTWAIL